MSLKGRPLLSLDLSLCQARGLLALQSPQQQQLDPQQTVLWQQKQQGSRGLGSSSGSSPASSLTLSPESSSFPKVTTVQRFPDDDQSTSGRHGLKGRRDGGEIGANWHEIYYLSRHHQRLDQQHQTCLATIGPTATTKSPPRPPKAKPAAPISGPRCSTSAASVSVPIDSKASGSFQSCTVWIHLNNVISADSAEDHRRIPQGCFSEEPPTKDPFAVRSRCWSGPHPDSKKRPSNEDEPSPAKLKRWRPTHKCVLNRIERLLLSGRNAPVATPRSTGDPETMAGPKRSGPPPWLCCHVCSSRYLTYDEYYTHLIDTTCATRRKSAEQGLPQAPPGEVANHYHQVQALLASASTVTKGNKEQPLQHGLAEKAEAPEPAAPFPDQSAMSWPEHPACSGPLNLSKKRTRSDQEQPRVCESLPVPKDHTTPGASPSGVDLTPEGHQAQVDDLRPRLRPRDPCQRPLEVQSLPRDGSCTTLTEAVLHRPHGSLRHPLGLLLPSSSSSETAPQLRKFLANGTKDQQQHHRHAAKPSTTDIGVVEHLMDRARLASIKAHVAELIAKVFGEQRLTELGYPDKDILDILNVILLSCRMKPYRVEDVDDLPDRPGSIWNDDDVCGGESAKARSRPAGEGMSLHRATMQQRTFLKLKQDIKVAQKNITVFFDFCNANRLSNNVTSATGTGSPLLAALPTNGVFPSQAPSELDNVCHQRRPMARLHLDPARSKNCIL